MDVHFESHTSYLFAHLSGQYSLSGMFAAIDKIAAQAVKEQAKRVLVDVSISGDAPIAERYQYATYAANVLSSLDRCAAYAGAEQRVEVFTELVAQNRGLELRVFPDFAIAERWLTRE
jgi:U3 small nucleolar RNA-associated protein 14